MVDDCDTSTDTLDGRCLCAACTTYVLSSDAIHYHAQVTPVKYEATTPTVETSQRTTTRASASEIVTTSGRNTFRVRSYHDRGSCDVEKFSFKQSTHAGLTKVGEFAVSDPGVGDSGAGDSGVSD